MEEYINVIWNVIEILATIFESIMISTFVTGMLGYKIQRLKLLKYFLFIILLVINTTFTPTIIQSDFVSGAIGTMICFFYSAIFLRKNIFYKFLIAGLSIYFILIINSIVLTITSSIFSTQISILLTESSTLRLAVVIITKFAYLIVTRYMLKLSKTFTLKLSRWECAYTMAIFVMTLVAGNMTFEMISAMRYSTSLSLFIFISLILVNIGNLIIVNKFHDINISRINMDKIVKQVYKDTKKFNIHQNEMAHNSNTQISDQRKNIITKHINDIITKAVKDCSEKQIILNCNISQAIRKFPENDIIAIISNLLKESISAYNKREYQPSIDFEVLNKDNNVSIIISHYVKMDDIHSVDEYQDIDEIPFNPYRNKAISHVLAKYNGSILRNQKRDKIITNFWLDFSSVEQ